MLDHGIMMMLTQIFEGETLNQQLQQWLLQSKDVVPQQNIKQLKGIIAPHAGLSYSGQTGAYSYRYLKGQDDLKIFLLGPSHYAYIQGASISQVDELETPMGNMNVDQKTIKELSQKFPFQLLQKNSEEQEHSLELHFPYIQKQLQGTNFSVIPIIVGNMKSQIKTQFSKILAEYFDQNNTVFIISSDFCHWGPNFDYQYYNKQEGEIYQSIEKLDKRGMNLIEKHDALIQLYISGFQDYLQETQNTICGREPIDIFLQVINNSKYKSQLKTNFVHYAQSNNVKKKQDSSVSYATSITYL